jgi:dipeptidyl aminopeptidase/acylaminoacyl peptidase
MRKSFYFLLPFLFVTALYAQKKQFTIADLYDIKSVGSPVLSPDGSKIAFTITESYLEKGKTNTEIYVMNLDGSGKTRMTYNKAADYNPFWNKSGDGIYFISNREGGDQIYLLSLAGGEAFKVTETSLGISSPVLSPDGKSMLLQANVFPECGADEECNKSIDGTMEEGSIQAHMADKLLFRHWTEYSDGKYSHIFLYNFDTKEYKDLTPGAFESPTFSLGGGSSYTFSPDGKEMCFMSKRVDNPASSTNSDLWLIPANGGEPKNITADNEGWDGSPEYSPDGKYIAYTKQLIPGYESDKFRLAVYNRATGENVILSEEFDNWVESFKWGNDSKTIYFTGAVQGYSPIFKISVDTKKIEKVSPDKAVFDFELTPKNDQIVYLSSSVDKPAEIYKYNIKSKKIAELSFVNKEFNEKVDIRPAEQVWVEGADGKKIHVFIVKPHNFDPNKKYPLVINVHGGPQMQWMDSFRGDWQVYPGAGYVVAFPNPHGSTGYGQDFTTAISGDWGGKVYEDVMKVTDYLEALPYVDKDKIGAMGWSYGGYMMNWLQAKTKRFKCLASMMGVYDLRSMYGATEELWFVEWDLKGQPWNSKLYDTYSPSNYVENFSTPTLVITGERDYRVPYTQSLEYFTDLQKMGIESRLIVFENDGHWPSGIRSMPLYYNSHLDWFHKYLGGEKAPYDMTELIRNRAFMNKDAQAK